MSSNHPKQTVSGLCRREGISRQAYYQARKRHRRRASDRQKLLAWIRRQRAKHPRMGGRKLYHKLAPKMRQAGIQLGRDKLFKLLRDHDLLVSPRKPTGPRTTNGTRTRWANKLKETSVDGPNQAWVADITYLRTTDGFCYLALISDKYSRKILGWDVAESLEMEGALRALQQATNSQGQASPIHHSDRGSQYRSRRYIQALQENNCRVSMTESDHCAENAQAERLNGILKNEYFLDHTFADMPSAQKTVREVIHLYNSDRPHMNLNYNTPDRVHRAA